MPDPVDPIAEVEAALARARASEPGDPTVMALATADSAGRPSVRVVLLKEIGPDGFVFYTNFESRKARELAENPQAALVVYWETLHLQVRVEGPAERLSDAAADAYFASRPRGSQIAAWASRQSHLLASRTELERRAGQAAERFAGGPVPRPPFWGGFRVRPERIELWYGREHRLHDRLLFERHGTGWKRSRLHP